MNWLRTIVDGIAMSAVFNLGVALVWLSCPTSFTGMFAKALQKIAPPRSTRDKKVVYTMYAILYPSVFIYGVVSAYSAGIQGFWNLFWTSYIEMFLINLGDFFGLDWYFREKMGSRLELPGTEGHELYSRKNWMKTLAVPEHWLLWPFVICPLVAFASAGIGMLIR